MKALINAPICPLMTRPSRQCELGDEALFGMAVEVLEETLPGWYRVRTPYRYEDYAPADCLLFGEHTSSGGSPCPSGWSSSPSATCSPAPL